MRTRAFCARWARARASGPAPSSAVSSRVEVPGAVAEPCRQALDTLALDDAVGDEPHRAAGDVGRDVPARRARRGVREAPLARPEAGGLRRCGGPVERHVADGRRAGRARRPAVDPGRVHRGVEDTVEPAVPAADRAVAGLDVEARRRERPRGRAACPPSCPSPPTAPSGNRTPRAAHRRTASALPEAGQAATLGRCSPPGPARTGAAARVRQSRCMERGRALRAAPRSTGGSRTPDRIRTGATALRGRRARPLHNGGWKRTRH